MAHRSSTSESEIRSIAKRIQSAMSKDQFRLHRMKERLISRLKAGKDIDREWTRWYELIDKSTKQVEKRQAQVPIVHYDDALPITAKIDEIRSAISNHQVTIVCGETGSGKSTQLPKICLEMGLAQNGLIGHTQPRRLAARTIASRLSDELKTSLGTAVGFKIRFTDKTDWDTYIKLMTDGILLAETQTDRFLDSYRVIIIDEAHERSLNIDFLLGYLTNLLAKRRELKLIVTSATIDADRFRAHFAQHLYDGDEQAVPIIEVSGRGYPVDILYQPLVDEQLSTSDDRPIASDDSRDDQDLLDGVADAIDQIAGLGDGDVLVFLPTEQEIRHAAKRLRGRILRNPRLEKAEVLPLYARLPTKEQNRVFESHRHRRIVLATNVAESSLTVPGIRFVVDTGTARISRYSTRSKVQRLPIEPVSQASANQRAGRCGRVGPGTCIRLYSEQDFLKRDEYTTPEIRRTNLAAVILRAMSLRLGDLGSFPFLDPPRSDAIADGFRTLFELGAIDQKRELTEIGKQLARLPVDPRVGRMILAADEYGCLSEILIIASALEVQDPRDRPPERQQQADQAHERFADQQSDFTGYLNIWDFYHELKEKLSQSKLRKACQQSFLSYQRMRQWADIHRQLLRLVRDAGLKVHSRSNKFEPIHRSLLTGLLSGIATKADRNEYLGARGVKFFLWPGSGVFSATPKWIVSAEIVETSRRFGRTIAKIEQGWIESISKHVVKRSYFEPHWSKKTDQCMAYERVTLYGLPIVARRRVAYGKRDPDLSRQLFISEGLVGGQYEGREPFLEANRFLMLEVEEMRNRSRKREFVIDDQTLCDFYDSKLPQDVIDGPSLRRKIQAESQTVNQSLTMTLEDLVPETDEEPDASKLFPNTLDNNGMRLNVNYKFEPGAEDDGVTVTVPAAGLLQLDRKRLEWIVPGLLEERIIALIRSLPKRIRRELTPAPDTAKKVAAELEFGVGDFLEVVASRLSQYAGARIPIEEFRVSKLAEHLRINVKVLDDEGKQIASDRNLDELCQSVGVDEVNQSLIEDDEWNQSGLTDWPEEDLPEQVTVRRSGLDVRLYPYLQDEGESVAIRLAHSQSVSRMRSRIGMARLLSLKAIKDLRKQVNWLPSLPQIKLWASSRLSAARLQDDIRDLIAVRAFDERKQIPRTRAEWDELLSEKFALISVATQDVAKLLPSLFESYHQAALALENLNRNKYGETSADIKSQINSLMYSGFLLDTPWEWLEQYKRYFQGIQFRIEKLAQSGPKEDDARREIQELLERLQHHTEKNDIDVQSNPALQEYRWMIEEYRVSLFAQKLGTYITVSAKRLEKQWKKAIRE